MQFLELKNPSDEELLSLGGGERVTAEQELVSLGDSQKVPLDETMARVRAAKMSFAMQDRSPGIDSLQNSIMNGQEGDVRRQFAVSLDLEFQKMKLQMVNDVARRKAEEGKGPLTDAELQFIMGLSQTELKNDPETIFETEYGRQFVNKLTQIKGGKTNIIIEALERSPEKTLDKMDIGSSVISRTEYAKTKLQDLEAQWSKTGWGSAIYQHVEEFVPLLSSYRFHNLVNEARTDSFLPGSNLKEQVQHLWLLPDGEFKRQLNQAAEELNKKNTLQAKKFMQAVISYGSSDALLDNVVGIVDGTIIGDVVAVGARVGSKALRVGRKVKDQRINEKIVSKRVTEEAGEAEISKAVKDTVKAANEEPMTLETVQAAVGDIDGAAVTAAFKETKSRLNGMDPLKEGTNLRHSIPSIFRVDTISDNPGALLREKKDRINAQLQANSERLIEAVTEPGKVTRLSDEALAAGIEKTEQELKSHYHRLNDAVIDVVHNAAEDNASTVHSVSLRVGRPDASLFDRADEASYWGREMYGLSPNEFIIKQQGTSFYIDIHKAVNETDDAVRDVLITTKNETPRGLANTFLGFLRNPEDTLSVANRENRHIATHGSQELHRLTLESAKAIGSLGKKQLERLQRLLVANRDFVDKSGQRGMFYRDLGEFEQAYTTMFKTAPTEKDAIAYFTYVQLNDFDWMVRNLGLHRDKSRMGIERHRYSYKFADENGGQHVAKTSYFEGRTVKEIPWDEAEDARIWVFDHESQSGTLLRKNEARNSADFADITNKVSLEGYKIVQVANPSARPLSKSLKVDDIIHFVVVKDPERAPLEWKQINYRPGGHVEYLHPWYVKQASIRRLSDGTHAYEGDTSIFNFASEAQARKFAERMDTARQLLRDGKTEELKAFLARNLPHSAEEFKGLFQSVTLKDGTIVPPVLHVDDPIRHTRSGQNMADTYSDLFKGYEGLTNEVRSPYNLYGQINKKYTSERDVALPSIRERTGEDGPLFKFEPSKFLDPLSTLNRAMANVMRSRYMNDYKIASVETFIQEFADVMKVSREELRKDPMRYLHNPVWDTQTTMKDRLAAAKNSRRAILDLLGTETDTSAAIRFFQDKLVNYVYDKMGQGASDFVASHLLPVTTDPFKYARSIAFHAKLGLFNPVQLWLQAQTLTHVAAVSGTKNAIPSLAAATLMRRLALTGDEKVVQQFAKMADRLGVGADDFIESYQALKKTGLWNVEGEVAWRDDIFDPKLFKGAIGTFLDKGTFFFREGERLVRLTAWHAAYREWKVANPGRALDNAARNEILTRQNLLSVNMTRASNATWQQGIFSVPTQFFAYQARLAEQFLGKRLTKEEKAQAFLTYSAMYGVPTAAGGVTAIWPYYDDVRQAALERGIDLSQPALKALVDGIPSLLFALITDKEYNFSQRFGPGGLSFLKEATQGKKTPVDLLFGASGSVIGEMIKSADPLAKGLVSIFRQNDQSFPVMLEDLTEIVQNVSTANNALKMVYAWNTGRYVSKHQIYLSDVSKMDALFMGLSGLVSTPLADAFVKIESLKEQKKAQDEAKKMVIKEFRRGLDEGWRGNEELMMSHMRRAKAYIVVGGFKETDEPALFSEAIRGYENLIDKINKDFWQKAPKEQYQGRMRSLFKLGTE